MKLFRRIALWWQVRLSRQIIIPAVLVTLLFLAALGFVAFRLGQNAVVMQVEARNRQLATQVGQEITIFFQTLLDTLRLQESQLLDTRNPERQAGALIALRNQFPYTYGDLRLLDAEGRHTLIVSGTLEQVLAGEPTWFDPPAVIPLDESVQAALETRSIVVSPVAFRPISNSPFVTMTLPLGVEGTSGALVAEIDLRSFWTRVDSLRIEDGSVSIVDQTGVILAHPDRRRVGQRLDASAIAPVFEGIADVTVYTQNAITYLAAYAPMRGILSGWGVIVEQQRSAALAPVRTIGLIATVVTALSAISVTLLLSNVVRRAVQPVEALSLAAADIAESGDLSRSLHDRGIIHHTPTNEIGVLTESFNRMITALRSAQERLQRWNEELEQRVAERTAQLETVMDVARISSASLQQQEILTTVLEQIGRLVDYDVATIMLLDNTGAFLETAATTEETALVQRRIRSLDKYPLNRAVIETRSAVIVDDTDLDPRWLPGDSPWSGRGSWLGIPLVVKERSIGVLALLKHQVAFYRSEDVTLLEALASQVAITLAHARLYEEAVQRVERELALAEEIQRHLFPTAAPQIDGLIAAAFYRPALETTGDFYEFIALPGTDRIPNGYLGIIVGDVSGKSLPAALLMAMARTALSSAARATPTDPAEVLRSANTVLVGDMPQGSFVASSYAAFSATDLTCDLVNAAQPAPFLLRNGQVMLLEGTGSHLPLGVIASPAYETQRVNVQPDDLIVFYTDGIIEARNRDRELFGFERLEAVICTCSDPAVTPQQVIERIIAAVTAWTGDLPQHDDIALMVLRVTRA